jgi:hypothetical protein
MWTDLVWKCIAATVILLVVAVHHQRKETREGIGAYFFGSTRSRWLDLLLVTGAYMASMCFVVAIILWFAGGPWVIAMEISAGLYLGDGLITHAGKRVPAHSDFLVLTLIGLVLAALSALRIHGTPFWMLAGLAPFFLLRVVAYLYRIKATVGR